MKRWSKEMSLLNAFYFANVPYWTGPGPVNFGNIHSTRIGSLTEFQLKLLARKILLAVAAPKIRPTNVVKIHFLCGPMKILFKKFKSFQINRQILRLERSLSGAVFVFIYRSNPVISVNLVSSG